MLNTADTPRTEDTWPMENEIDLRQYLDVLIRWRGEIVIITLATMALTALIILGLRLLLPATYEASADVAIVRTKSNIELDERFRTTAEDTLNSIDSRRSALVILATSGSIATQVIDRLGDQLSRAEQAPDALGKNVKITVTNPEIGQAADSDLIRIIARADSPAKAVAIANTWAEILVTQANAVYGQVPDELYASVDTEVKQADQQYKNSQAALESFTATSQADQLTRQIADQQKLIDGYSEVSVENQLAAVKAEQEARRTQLENQLQALYGTADLLFQEQYTKNVELLQAYYSSWISTTLALNSAQSLRLQVEQGGDAATASNRTALELLKVRVYSNLDPQSRVELQTGAAAAATPPTAEAMLQDVDALVAALQGRQADLAAQIGAHSQMMIGGDSFTDLAASMPADSDLAQTVQRNLPLLLMLGNSAGLSMPTAAVSQTTSLAGETSFSSALAAMNAELRNLKAQLEGENARLQQLTQLRDVHWETYRTLLIKVAELKLARAAANSELRFAGLAVPPSIPVPGPSLGFALAASAIVGLLLAIIVALAADALGRRPFLARAG